MAAIAETTVYRRMSRSYDSAHTRWLAHAGGEAQCAFEGAAAALLAPGMRVLDAGCGTGTVARRLARLVDGDLALTLLDAEPDMLAQCHDLGAVRVEGRIEAMPFQNDRFDLVTCAWAIETLRDPAPALVELVRVCRVGGHVVVVFCADRPARSVAARALRVSIAARGLGRFLEAGHVMRLAASAGARAVRPLHCSGPAAALLISV